MHNATIIFSRINNLLIMIKAFESIDNSTLSVITLLDGSFTVNNTITIVGSVTIRSGSLGVSLTSRMLLIVRFIEGLTVNLDEFKMFVQNGNESSILISGVTFKDCANVITSTFGRSVRYDSTSKFKYDID